MRRGIGRRQAIGIVGAGLLAAGAAAAGAAPPRPAALPVETLATSTLEGVRESRVYVSDIAINHIADGRVRVYDAVDGRLLGMIPSAYAGNFTLSDRRDELYLATTHLSRSSRGRSRSSRSRNSSRAGPRRSRAPASCPVSPSAAPSPPTSARRSIS